MGQLLSYRNWSLLIVSPAIGLLVIVINFPILVKIWDVLQSAKCLISIKDSIVNSSILTEKPVMYAILVVISYFLGFMIEAINSTWWDIKTKWNNDCNHKSAHYKFVSCCGMKTLQRFRGWFFSLLPCIGTCKGDPINCSYSDNAEKAPDVGTTHMHKSSECCNCPDHDEKADKPQDDSERPPRCGEREYAEFQLFLERKKEFAAYVEWEKFLASFYEYLVIVLTLSAGSYLTYGVLYAFRARPDGVFGIKPDVDWWFLACYVSILFFYFCLHHASVGHTHAKNSAEKAAFKAYIEEKKEKERARGARFLLSND